MRQLDVAIIVVGLNAREYVKGCFESVANATWKNYTYETIYVDNGSTDNSVEVLGDLFPEMRIIANEKNLGFCKAANQGAEAAQSRYHFFLNDDTIVLGDALPQLIEFLDEHPEAGAVGSRLLNLDRTDQWSGRRFPSPLNAVLGRRSALSRWLPNAKALTSYIYRDQVEEGTPFVADWVSAAAVLVRRDVFGQIGGFAEDYYYWHEAIFCDRVRKAKYEVYLHPQSKIVHYEGKGSGKRPYRVRKWHIVNFHKGAYQCYCEHYNLSRFNPLRWLAAGMLGTRAVTLIAANRLSAFGEKS